MKPRHGSFGGLLLLLSAAVGLGGCGAVRAGRLLQDALDPPPDLALRVQQTQTSVAAESPVPVRVYRPIDEEGPLPGIVLVHGAVEAGADDRRIVSLARALAVRGCTVVTPHLESLARFTLDRRDPGRLAAVASWLAAREDLALAGRVACFGISVGGSYCLIAAADPALRDRVSVILTFGAYADLRGLLRAWLMEPGAGTPELFDPRTTGRRLVLLGNVAALVSEPDRPPVEASLKALLDARPTPTHPPAPLGPAAARVLAVARSTTSVSAEETDLLLAPLEVSIQALSPSLLGIAPAAPIYLLHASGDPVVPASALSELAAVLQFLGARVETQQTDLFEHVGARTDVSFFDALPLLCFLASALDDAGL